MQLQTFLARGMKDALADVRDRMGPDAVIISSETAPDGSVIVRAALDEADALDDVAFSDEAIGDIWETTIPEPLTLASEQPEQMSVEAQVRTIRAKSPRRGRRRFDRGELLTIFAHHRLPDGLAHALAEKSAGTGINDMTLALAAAIDVRMKSAPIDYQSDKALLLLGLGGVGKTATVAKLAAHAQLAGRAVTLIGADTEGAGAVARLGAFAEHLKAEILSAASPTQLDRRVHEALGRGHLAIVDTAGFDPRQAKAAEAMQALAQIADVEAIGVVSAMTDGEEICEIASALGRIGVSRLVVTQLDLARRFGALAGVAMCEGLRLAHTTRSPFVAAGLDAMTPLMLARLLVENEEESVQ